MDVHKEAVNRLLRHRWAIFAILAIAYFLVYFHRTSTSVVGSDIGATFGVGATSIALLGSSYFFVYTVMQLPSGILADRWGPRNTVSLFLIIAAIGSLITAIAPSFEVVLAGRILTSVGVAMVYIPTMRILAMWFRSDEFASLSGVLLAVGNAGAIVAATPLAVMTASYGWQNVYLILALLTATLPVLCYLIVVDRPSKRGLPDIQTIERRESGVTDPAPALETFTVMEGVKTAFQGGRKFWPLAVWFFIIYGTVMMYQGLQMGPYYRNIYGMEDYSLMITMVGVGIIAGSPVSGLLSDKILKSRRKVLIIGTLLYTAVWLVLWLTAGQFDSIMIQATINFTFGFFGGWFIVAFAQIKEMFPLAIVGTVTASLNIFPFAGGALFQVASGLVVTSGTELSEFKTLWFFAFLCMLVACVAAYLTVERER